MFVLPVAPVLVAVALCDIAVEARRSVLAVMTLITVWTQRPLQAMTTDSYFLDWFSLYRTPGLEPVPPEVSAVWIPRLVTLVLWLVAAFFVIRHAIRTPAAHA